MFKGLKEKYPINTINVLLGSLSGSLSLFILTVQIIMASYRKRKNKKRLLKAIELKKRNNRRFNDGRK